MTKKEHNTFVKDAEHILINAGATVKTIFNMREFMLPTYYGKDAMFHIDREYTKGCGIFRISCNTRHYDTNLGNLLGIKYYNNKSNIIVFDADSALSTLEYKIRILQRKPEEI